MHRLFLYIGIFIPSRADDFACTKNPNHISPDLLRRTFHFDMPEAPYNASFVEVSQWSPHSNHPFGIHVSNALVLFKIRREPLWRKRKIVYSNLVKERGFWKIIEYIFLSSISTLLKLLNNLFLFFFFLFYLTVI